jgi:hypothetical protein
MDCKGTNVKGVDMYEKIVDIKGNIQNYIKNIWNENKPINSWQRNTKNILLPSKGTLNIIKTRKKNNSVTYSDYCRRGIFQRRNSIYCSKICTSSEMYLMGKSGW